MATTVTYVDAAGRVVHEQVFYVESLAKVLVKDLARARALDRRPVGLVALDGGPDGLPPVEIVDAVLAGRVTPRIVAYSPKRRGRRSTVAVGATAHRESLLRRIVRDRPAAFRFRALHAHRG